MADIYIDCEWVKGEDLTLIGAYSYGNGCSQLYGNLLTKYKFSKFINACANRNCGTDFFLFCHGPDIGKIENYFDINLRDRYYCINTIKAFKRFTRFQSAGLKHLESYFGLPRNYDLDYKEINTLWNSGEREIILDYNKDDCINLWRLVRILIGEYGVTRSELRSIAM